MASLHELTASAAAARIAVGELTSEALVEACLARIEARETEIGAWQHLDGAHALAQARARDGEPPRGLLHGVPIAIKDIIDTVDMPTTYGSSIYGGYRASWDASCVAACREAGAVIMGTTVSTEFAYFHPGKTRNPHNLAHTPGGSSSGSAAAVAEHMVPIGFASQTAGSVVRPASFCGVVGYKGTYGLFAMAGIKPFAQSLDTLGVFTRDVADAALMRAVLLGIPLVHTAIGAPPRVGLCRTHEWAQADAEMRDAVETAAGRLADAGADVAEAPLPASFGRLVADQLTVMTFEAGRSFNYEHREHRAKMSETMVKIIEDGRAIPHAAYREAQERAATCRIKLSAMFADHDVLIAPSSVGAAPAGIGATGDPLFNRIWTLLGVPCVNLPHYRAENGLPLGIQLIGPHGRDENLLAAAAWAQTSLGGGN
jgi:Asp-tRNA(Asn)/Glu-tRNA(Gln) amidotransferase A subunit family amidase